jgi:hypothetical protein
MALILWQATPSLEQLVLPSYSSSSTRSRYGFSIPFTTLKQQLLQHLMIHTPFPLSLLNIIDQYLVSYRWLLFGSQTIYTDLFTTSSPPSSNDINTSLHHSGRDGRVDASGGYLGSHLKWCQVEDPSARSSSSQRLSGYNHGVDHVMLMDGGDTLLVHVRHKPNDIFLMKASLVMFHIGGTPLLADHASTTNNDVDETKTPSRSSVNTNMASEWILSTMEHHETLDETWSSMACYVHDRFYIAGGVRRFKFDTPSHSYVSFYSIHPLPSSMCLVKTALCCAIVMVMSILLGLVVNPSFGIHFPHYQ